MRQINYLQELLYEFISIFGGLSRFCGSHFTNRGGERDLVPDAIEESKSEYKSDLNPPLRPAVPVLLTVGCYQLNVAIAPKAGSFSRSLKRENRIVVEQHFKHTTESVELNYEEKRSPSDIRLDGV